MNHTFLLISLCMHILSLCSAGPLHKLDTAVVAPSATSTVSAPLQAAASNPVDNVAVQKLGTPVDSQLDAEFDPKIDNPVGKPVEDEAHPSPMPDGLPHVVGGDTYIGGGRGQDPAVSPVKEAEMNRDQMFQEEHKTDSVVEVNEINHVASTVAAETVKSTPEDTNEKEKLHPLEKTVQKTADFVVITSINSTPSSSSGLLRSSEDLSSAETMSETSTTSNPKQNADYDDDSALFKFPEDLESVPKDDFVAIPATTEVTEQELLPQSEIIETTSATIISSTEAEVPIDYLEAFFYFLGLLDIPTETEEDSESGLNPWQKIIAGIQCAMRDCRAALPGRPTPNTPVGEGNFIIRKARGSECSCSKKNAHRPNKEEVDSSIEKPYTFVRR